MADGPTTPPLNFGDFARASSRDSQRMSHETPDASREIPGAYTRRIHELRPERETFDYHRPHSPGLPWHSDYSHLDPKNGRVLVIDFVKQNYSASGQRKILAEEIDNPNDLRKLYSNQKRRDEALLRVFHVQNAHWAAEWLLRKFNIDNRNDLVGTDFGKYVRHKKTESRGGKPFVSGKSWRTQHDPWRGVAKTSFGMDYLKEYRAKDPAIAERSSSGNGASKMMELNCYDEDDNPTYGYDVYVQRISCYIQHKEIAPENVQAADVVNPYREALNGKPQNAGPSSTHGKKVYIPKLEELDNDNTIIIFETSATGKFEDTLIAARQQGESRWRRLPFYLAYESKATEFDDDHLAVQYMKMILDDVFKNVVFAWGSFLDVAYNHISILEEKMYDQPADETRAPELWANSSAWLKVEKLLFVHIDVMKEMKVRLVELCEDVDKNIKWLEDAQGAFDRLAKLIAEDLVKPTENLIQLLYQSVSIRDSRHSLQLGVSMWRLSWITFIFLPLTFMVGFFGMNVDTFAGPGFPKIKYYFYAAVPFMLLILICWYLTKHMLARNRQTPQQRGIYERFFHEMSVTNPRLWSRAGPRDYITPIGKWARLKWALIKFWSRPERTVARPSRDDDDSPTHDDLGTWSKFKRFLIKRWSAQIEVHNAGDVSVLEGGGGLSRHESDFGPESDHPVANSIIGATELLTMTAARPGSPSQLLGVPPTRFERSQRPISMASDGVISVGGSPSPSSRDSRIMVEEEDVQWLSARGREGNGWTWSKDKKKSASSPPPAERPDRGRSTSAGSPAARVQQSSRHRRWNSLGLDGISDDERGEAGTGAELENGEVKSGEAEK